MSEVPAKEPNLDKEGDLAADYLEELLDIADLDGDIEISVDRDRATVAIVIEGEADSRLRRLIGKHGEGVNALQSLTRLAVQQQTGERSRLMVDIAGYRQERREKVSELAEQAIQEVIDTGDEIELDPMNPFERKVVHDAVAAAGLLSDSEGYGSHRHVVIKPADDEYGEYEIVSDEDDDEYDDYDEHEDSAASAESAD